MILSAILFGCMYLSSVIFIMLAFPFDKWPTLASFDYSTYKNILTIFYNAWKTYITRDIPITADGFLPIKLIVTTFTPCVILLGVAWYFRAVILEWQPYKKYESIFGDAKWSNDDDIRRAKLRSKEGLIVGKYKRKFLIVDGFQHTLLFAPTGSGKGVGFVIPNLLFWKQSVFVHDIKLENFELTSGYRKNQLKQDVYLWNPASPVGKSHCYNPLDWISEKPGQMVDDVQKIAAIMLPEMTDFWQSEARSLLVGLILYVCADPDRLQSFGEIVRTIRSDDVVYSLAVVLDTMGGILHPVSYMNIAAFLQKADKEKSGVLSTLNSSIELWANPIIDTATATSDFNILEFKKRPTTVYVGVTPDNIKRLQPLMQIFYQQATEFLTRTMPSDEEPLGVLFMMDEFPSLGKMDQFKIGIAYFRGYRVRLFLIIQDTEQLRDIYEEAGMNSFISNSTYRITFAANNYQTAELISKMVGNKSVDNASLNKPKFLDLNPGARSLNVSKTQRALLLPQEVMNLDRDEQIMLVESFPPIKSFKIKYYEDKFFKKRLLPEIDVPTQEPYDPNKFKKSKDGEEGEDETLEVTENTNPNDGNQEEIPMIEEEPKDIGFSDTSFFSDDEKASFSDNDSDNNNNNDEGGKANLDKATDGGSRPSGNNNSSNEEKKKYNIKDIQQGIDELDDLFS